MRLSRFDIIAVGVGVALIATLALTVLFGTPAPLGARIAYLPSRGLPNIWAVDPAKPDPAQQLTFAENGIFDFEASPDGRYIAYSQQSKSGIRELMLLELATGATRPLTNCEQEDADCTAPTWRPDGQTIAYERVALNRTLNLQAGAARIWLLDVATGNTFPLFTESQILGYGPQWSGDGSRIALYDSINQNVLVYNFNVTSENEQLDVVSAGNGVVGALSPDGTKLAFPELVLDTNQTRAVLRLADLNTGAFQSLTPDDEIVYDLSAVWHPDGKRLAFTRQHLDERYTLGHQVYFIDTTNNSVMPLIYDENYTHGAISWNQEGTQLVVQRSQIPSTATTTPEIWVYTLATGELTRVAADGYIPRWIPAADR